MSKLPSSFKYLSRLMLAKLQAELSRCIYSLQGLEALIRPALGVVCQRLTVVSNCIPGSAHSQAACAIWRKISRALSVWIVLLVVTAFKSQLPSFCTACIKSSVTRNELLAFWYWTEKESFPSKVMSKPALSNTRALRSSIALHQINSSTSGWEAFIMTILAARRVLPPLLMAPAEASAPRIKLSGPEAVPALLPSGSLELRRLLTLMPEPLPPLKIIPSSKYQLRMAGIVSSTARIKQALACCARLRAPILNQTGELKAARWVAKIYFSSSQKSSASEESTK